MNERIYNKIVRSNPQVNYEYDCYVKENIEKHHANKLQRWTFLFGLVWHYKVRKKTEHYRYPQQQAHGGKVQTTRISKEKVSGGTAESVEPHSVAEKKVKIDSNYVLDRAESTITERVKPFVWVKGMMDFDVISFDIFDTLLLRKISDPKDLYVMLGKEFGIVGFSNIRFEAEKSAREKKLALFGNREVTIYDIYNEVSFRTGLDVEYGIRKEFEYEMKICFTNPYMKVIFDLLKYNQKRIVITSDMYWPSEYLNKLLEHNGYTGYEQLLVSCEWKGGKRNGVLFERLERIAGRKKTIVHIGDNQEADIKAASARGISTRYYKNVQEAGAMFRENGQSVLVRSAYRGIVNSVLHNGMNKFTEQYEYGFVYGGLFTLGYVNWIHRLAIDKKADKVLFLARDGYIYKKIYDKLYDDVKSEYALWSRVASMKYASDYTREDFLKRNIEHKIGKEWSILSMLTTLNLQEMAKLLPKHGLKADEVIHAGNKKQIEEFFVTNWSYMLELQEQGQDYAKEYYKKLVGDSKRVIIVDTGWRGDNQLGLKRLIEDKWRLGCEVLCCMAASVVGDRNISYISDGTLFCYMFSNSCNRMLFDSFNKNMVVNMALFEMFSQSPCPSFDGFDEKGNPIFGYAEVENYSYTIQILQGIEDFCDRYVEAFGEFESMMNISGYDAYLPFRGFVRNYRLAKVALGGVRFQQVIGIDKQKQSTKTLIEVMRENNL